MRIAYGDDYVVVWLSRRDTREWAEHWPCSTLVGHSFRAVFDSNGLCDFTVDGKCSQYDVAAYEFNAICADLCTDKLPKDHPLYFMLVEQYANY